MPDALTISKARPEEPGLDQEGLYARGLAFVRELSHRVWTDHNIHDPGITTLELLCYALTDLTYRASFPIEDLLASEGGDGAAHFPTAREILPIRPLTLLDYRKLVIDLPGVKNAWILPHRLTYHADTAAAKLRRDKPALPGIRDVEIRGLHDVLVEYMDHVGTAEEREDVHAAVLSVLHQNRSLCEDFVGVSGVERQPFILCGEIELRPDANAAAVEAEVLHRVQDYLAPAVHNYTLSEMLARKKADGQPWSVQEIFEGPALVHGFIDDAELERADLREAVRLSDVVHTVMDIEGVAAVRDLILHPEGLTTPLPDRWLVPVEGGKQPTLNRQKSRLVLYKRGMPISTDDSQVATAYDRLAEEARKKLETPLAPEERDLAVPAGKPRKARRYFSFQNHYPALYGLGELGVPSGADDARRAKVYQLKAYLLFFDQVMANYLAQLARVKDLFSTDPKLSETYFYEVVDSFTAFEKIYDSPKITENIREASPEERDAAFRALVEDDADREISVERRNRFLDHLVARFAERFHEYASVMYTSFQARPSDAIRPKCEFLRDYPAVSAGRGLAYNRTLREDGDLWNTANVSGLERRIASLLGIANWSRRSLSDIPHDVYSEIDETPGDELRFRVRHRDTQEILLSSTTSYATAELARAEMKEALRFARMPSGYQRGRTQDGRHYFTIVDDTGAVLAWRNERFDTAEKMEEAIEELIAYVARYYGEEGMFLVENILLRPEADLGNRSAAPDGQDEFLPICVDPSCTGCADDDPYSYRIHFVLPAFAGRFVDMDFRRFVEEVIREETPAHILPKVCWVSRDDMTALEGAYREWLAAGAGSGTRAAELRALVAALYAVKNVYPSRKLAECDSPEGTPKFLLGRTSLGSGGTDGGS